MKIKKTEGKIDRSIRQRVGRAVAGYRRDEHENVSYRVIINDDGTFLVLTTAASGDNVGWATQPMGWIVSALLPIAKPIKGSRCHCCGNVSEKFRIIDAS